jgi:twitching motility protein PilT
MRAAPTAAETGMLVYATLHTNDAAQSIDRIIDVFPVEEQAQVRAMLAESLSGVLSRCCSSGASRRGASPRPSS